jgi:hypothetical protein
VRSGPRQVLGPERRVHSRSHHQQFTYGLQLASSRVLERLTCSAKGLEERVDGRRETAHDAAYELIFLIFIVSTAITVCSDLTPSRYTFLPARPVATGVVDVLGSWVKMRRCSGGSGRPARVQ